MKKYIVYKHIFPNGKIYIGITNNNLNNRFKNGKGYSHSSKMTAAIQKYGWDNIKHEILCEGLSKEEAEFKEIELIAKYKSNQKEFGYNTRPGGKCNETHSDEVKEKLSISLTGRIMNKEWRKKLSESQKGRKLSNETKNKIANSLKRPILQFDRYGKFIKEWTSSKEASTSLDIHLGSISECCHNKRRTAGGYIWKFKM